MTDQRGSAKFFIVVALLGAAMVGLVVRLVVLHLGGAEQERAITAKTRTFKQKLSVPRGRILDGSSSAGILALNIGVKDIWVDPAPLIASNRVQSTITALRTLLDFDVDEVTTRLCKTNNRFAYIARHVPEDRAEQVAQLKLFGVHMNDGSTRSYPQGRMLCHVLGFVNADSAGSGGIEQLMEKYLQGTPGLIESQLDGRRREMMDRRVREIPPKDGSDVLLTIDQNIQYMMEKAVDAAMEKTRAKSAFAIMERVKTGEILGLVSRPGFDPSKFREARDDQKLNRAIGMVYDPGSTFKVATISAALNEGLVKPETMFDTENGRWLYQKKILRDYHSYSRLNVAEILQKSSNIGTAKIGIMLGDARLERYLRAFNIGSKLGIDLPGEENGILRPSAKWAPIVASRVSIGQGVSVTGVQMLGIVCAVANDGMLMKPYVIKEVVAADGTVLLRRQPEVIGRPIRPDTAKVMRKIMAGTCEPGGTGTKAKVEGFRVAGKTGTAQKVIAGHYSETDYMASFAGFLPAEEPEIAMIVVFDSPQPLHTGGIVSAPVFREIAEQAVRYLGILPSEAEAAQPVADRPLKEDSSY